MSTEPRRLADDFAAPATYAGGSSQSDAFEPMSQASFLARRTPIGTPAGPRGARRAAGFAIATAAAASVALLLAGCATPVAQPAVELPKAFAAAPSSAGQVDTAWWQSFGDPVLTDLVQRAERENRDIAIAVARLRASRAGETVSRSFLAPSISASGAAARLDNGYGGAAKLLVPDIERASGGLDVQWELDLSGRLRAGADAAAAEALAAENGVRGVRLLVMSDVATHYFTLAGALRQLETLRAISAAQDQTLRLVQARYRAGLATPFDVERAQTDAESARAQIPPLETVAAVSRHRIAVLIGDQAGNAARIEPSRGAATVPQPQPGQPAALLQRRPDVLALMAQLDAANARRQQAAAEWFPRLFIDASFGRQNVDLAGIGLGSARYLNAGALLAMPIFNAGRTQAINDIAEAGQREALLRAEDGIVRALEDVENALVALSSERQRAQSLQAAAAAAEAALGRAQSLYDRGQVDLLPLLDAQRSRLAVRLGANDSQTRLLLDSVQLYKALGGGWQVFEPAAQAAQQPPTQLARASQP